MVSENFVRETVEIRIYKESSHKTFAGRTKKIGKLFYLKAIYEDAVCPRIGFRRRHVSPFITPNPVQIVLL